MTVIINKQPGGVIEWAAEVLIDDDKRFLRVRRRYGDGADEYRTDEWLPMPWCDEPLLVFMDTDIDEGALRDVYQSVVARRQRGKTLKRENKPDIQQWYQDMNEARRAELAGRKHFLART